MVDYRKANTDFAENLCVEILEKWGLKAKRNNLECIGNVDVIVEDAVKIDIQYSQNFALYGDLRLDFVSAYSRGEKSHATGIFGQFETRYGFHIDKVGKYFQDDYLDAVMVLFYDDKIHAKPDKIMLIRKDELLCYLNENTQECLQNLKLNDKKGLGDTHGSAFLPIRVEKLCKSVKCFFGTQSELESLKDEIKGYLLAQNP